MSEIVDLHFPGAPVPKKKGRAGKNKFSNDPNTLPESAAPEFESWANDVSETSI
jgi:hypothetical protein